MIASWISTLTFAGLAMALPVSKRGFSGQATFYDAGLGNCGTTVSPNAMVVALNTAQYGSTSTVSSHCFKTVVITNLGNGNTATAMVQDSCPTCAYGSLDMSTALFSKLNNGNMDAGVFPISWTFAGSSSGSGSSSNSGSSNSNNNNGNSNSNSRPQTSSSSPKPTSTYSAPAPASTSSASEAITPPPPPSFLAPTNTTLVNGTVATTPAWWDELDTSCWEKNVTLPSNVTGVVISPSKFANTTADLSGLCGNWINATNTDNGKSILAMVISYVPGGVENQIALSNGYTDLANVTDGMPGAIANIEWGVIAGNSTANATATA